MESELPVRSRVMVALPMYTTSELPVRVVAMTELVTELSIMLLVLPVIVNVLRCSTLKL